MTAAGLHVRILDGGGIARRVAYGTTTILPLEVRAPERSFPAELDDLRPTPLEPSPPIGGSKREPIVIDPLPPRSQYRVMWGVGQLLRFAITWLRLKLAGQLDEERRAVLTRQLFERMSGIWIKAGQLLSLRGDLMSPAMTRELSSLQYQARGFPPETAVAVIEQELGRPLGAVFAQFETAPFAAASIAQVHRATLLHNNRAVMVKVMRPDVARSFARDLRLIEFMVRWSTRFGLFKRFRLSDGMAEMRAILTEETDYHYEAVNLRRMRRNLKRHDIHVPRIVKTLCGRRILVIEEIPGVLMSQYLRVRREDPDRAYRWALANGIEDKALARRLSTTVLRQILEDNEFHGDLHPGNIMLLADNNIALIDFGSVGRLQQQTWVLYRYSLAALAMREYGRAADLMLMMSPSIALSNTRRLRLDMTLALRNWELAGEFPNGRYSDRSMAAMSSEVARVMAEHRVPLSWGIMRVGRSLSTLDASLQTLVPDANFMNLARSYFKDRQRRGRTLEGRRESLDAVMRQVSGLLTDANLLLGTGIRDQALRLHGAMDRLTHVRVILLTFAWRALVLLLVLVAEAFVFETFFPDLPADGHVHVMPGPAVHFIQRALPQMHPIHWILLLIFVMYMLHLVQALRAAVARL